MLVSEAISIIRERINDEFDTGYSTDNLINYINDAIKYLSSALITRNDPILVKTITILPTSNAVPKNFVRFAGGFPVKRMGDEFKLIGSNTSCDAKYFYVPDNVTAETDSLPFANNDVYDMILVNMASIYAMNKHEYNVQQDTSLKQELEQIIVSALGEIT